MNVTDPRLEHAGQRVGNVLPLTPGQRAKLEERRRCRSFEAAEVDLPPLPEVPGMTSEAEGRYLYWLTSRAYMGAGAVVEVGSWLGCSTIHLAAGLKEAGHHRSLHCFDQFQWRHGHHMKAALPLRTGDDFQPYFERNVRLFYPYVQVTKTTIRDISWRGGPIEILFLDAPKTLVDLASIFAAFGPSLVPGLSLVVFQDYQHFPSYPIPAVVGRLESELALQHVVMPGATVSFEVVRPLDYDLAQPVAWNFARWTRDEAVAAWARILAPLPPVARSRVAPGLALLLYDSQGKKAAREVLAEMGRGEEMAAEWHRYGSYPFYDEYRALFRFVGAGPLHGKHSALDPLRWKVRQLRVHLIRPLKQAVRSWLEAAIHPGR